MVLFENEEDEHVMEGYVTMPTFKDDRWLNKKRFGWRDLFRF